MWMFVLDILSNQIMYFFQHIVNALREDKIAKEKNEKLKNANEWPKDL